MAGLGRKVFNSGDILLASEVQGYLQDQAVMVFDDSATRATAIGTANFSEGMVTYTKDDDAIQVYDGSAFVGVGSDSGLIHIETRTVSAVAAESFNNVFSSTYDNYRILFVGNSSDAQPNFEFRLRVSGSDNSTASSYKYQTLSAASTTVSGSRDEANLFTITALTSDEKNSFAIDILSPFLATQTSFQVHAQWALDPVRMFLRSGFHNQTVSYDGFTLFPSSGNFTGSVSVYGYRKA